MSQILHSFLINTVIRYNANECVIRLRLVSLTKNFIIFCVDSIKIILYTKVTKSKLRKKSEVQ